MLKKTLKISIPKIQKDLLNLGLKKCFRLKVRKKLHNLGEKTFTLKVQKRFKKFYIEVSKPFTHLRRIFMEN